MDQPLPKDETAPHEDLPDRGSPPDGAVESFALALREELASHSSRVLQRVQELVRELQGRDSTGCAENAPPHQAEAALRESEERHRIIVEGARDYAILTTDPQGRITSWSPGAEAVFGWSAAEALDCDVAMTFTPEDRATGQPEKEREQARLTGSAADVRWHVRKDGSPVFIEGVMRPLQSADGEVRSFLKVGQDVTERRKAEEVLQENEARMSAIFSRAAVGLSEVALDGRFLRVNEEMSRILGRSREELLTLSAPDVLHPDSLSGVFAAIQRALQTEGAVSLDKVYVRPDGTCVWANSNLTLLRDAAGNPRSFLSVTADMTERRQADEARREAMEAVARLNTELEARVAERTRELMELSELRQDLLRRLVFAQEEERRRIARDLHDDTSQQVTALLLGLKRLESDDDGDPSRSETIRRLQELAQGLAEKSHRLAVTLRPTALDDLGLVTALEQYTQEWTGWSGIPVELEVVGLDSRLPPEVETTLYRIAQEALTNILRHGGGEARAVTRVGVLLQRRNGEVLAVIEDNGPGFNLEASLNRPPGERRVGVFGMQERARLAGGTLAIESLPGRGTTVSVRLPLPAEEARHA